MEPFGSLSLVTVDVRGRVRTGIRFSGGVVDLRQAVLRATGKSSSPKPLAALLARGLPRTEDLWGLLANLDRRGDLPDVLVPEPFRTLLPFRPGKVIAVGRNYAKHARELGNAPPAEPFFFGKATSCCVGPGEPIVLPHGVPGEIHHEAELAVVIGRPGKRIPERLAMEWVAGYTCANDVTARTLQKRLQEQKLPWFAAKNCDSFLPLGPGLALREGVPDLAEVRIRCLVDGEVRQDAPALQMVHGVAALVAHASRRLTLDAGDVILTGTPEGVGPLTAGQHVEVRIDGVGSLLNPVVSEALPA